MSFVGGHSEGKVIHQLGRSAIFTMGCSLHFHEAAFVRCECVGAQTMRCIPCPSQRLWPANDLYSEEAERCWLSLSLGRVSECQRLATEPNLTGTLTWQLQQQICCMCFHFTRSVAKAHGRVLISEQVCGRAWKRSAQPRPNFQHRNRVMKRNEPRDPSWPHSYLLLTSAR